MPANTLFAATNLACLRGERLVFSGLSLALGPGEVLVLRGPNGSGKSSLLRLMAGLARPEAGELTWAGNNIVEDPAGHRARLHFIGHLDAIKPALNVGETLRFWAQMHGGTVSIGSSIDRALAYFRLTGFASLPCRLLSAGERKRVALARLLATPADLWLLDEPTTALDAAAEADLIRAIAGHRADGGRAVIATHAPLTLAAEKTLALDDFTARRRALAA